MFKKIIGPGRKIFTILSALLLALPLIPPARAAGALADWQYKGVSIQSMWNGDFASSDFKQSVDNAQAMGANYITLVFNLYQPNLSSTDIQTGADTPTDQALADGIDYIHSKGLKVMIKPHLNSYTGEWRAGINPSDRQAWFTKYGQFIDRYAQIAQAHGVEDFCLGTELIDMSVRWVNPTNTQNWDNLIAGVRKIYSGKLTYSANWGGNSETDEKDYIDFWDKLDYIGISAYFNLYGDNSISNMKVQWDAYRSNEIQPLSQKWSKQIVFTETGYRSVPNAHQQPWDYNLGGGYDPTEQVNDYQALFDYWQNYSFMKGIQIWQWSSNPNSGGAGNTDYTPQNKPAQDTIKQWFTASGAVTPPGTTASFTVSASANPATVSNGQSTTISVSATANNGTGSGIILDAEVYNSSGQRVSQQIYDNQNFNNGQTKNYSFNFTPSTNDNYKIKVGVFNYNWSQLYIWNDSAGSFGASGGSSGGGGGSNPPPTSGSINIWWPSNGASVSGTQPFKADMPGWDVSQYNMYWQVDGGGLVVMRSDNTDYPHKQFDADLRNWTWKGNGPYTITFVSKDLSGNTVAQASSQIYVWQ